jgi:SAM-dependent methyltransferase
MFALRKTFAGWYERLVECSCSEQPFPVPASVQRQFVNPSAFECVATIRKFVSGAQRVLIVGDGGGRDYYSLKLLGRKPVVMDISNQSIIPEIVIADANAPFPFAPRSFDAVVMAEVLEHLPNDFQALSEIREILRDDGALVLTVPYFHDAEPTHIRVHSPASVERLLRASGWKIIDCAERGGGLCRLIEWLPLRVLVHSFNALLWIWKRKTAYQPLYRAVWAVDRWLGRKCRWVHRWSRSYGALIQCSKAEPVDWVALNRRAFQNMHLKPPEHPVASNRHPHEL